MAQDNKNNGNSRGDENSAPAQKPQATPAELAKLVSQVSALLADLYPQEQLRVLASVKVINGIQESAQPQQRQQQRPPTNTNTNNNNRRGQ
jgi:hypothetical protein